MDILNSFPDECIHVIETMREIYNNDAIVKECSTSADQRLTYHQQYSKPLMDQLRQWGKKQLDEKLLDPNCGLGKVIKYLLNHWGKAHALSREQRPKILNEQTSPQFNIAFVETPEKALAKHMEEVKDRRLSLVGRTSVFLMILF